MLHPVQSSARIDRALPAARGALGAALLAVAGGCGSDDAPSGPPHVLLLSVDSLRQDHASAYGYESNGPARESTTPTFDALAARGVLFENARSTTSWTLPSHMALFTGLPDPLHGVVENRHRLADQTITLAQLFSDAGYATGGFFSGPNLHPTFGFDRGFDEYVDCSRVEVAPDAFEGLEDRPVGSLQGLHRSSHTAVTSPGLVEAAGRYASAILDRGRRPLFCFVHWWDPHYDYLAPEAYVGRFTRGGYDGRFRGDYLTEKSSLATARDAQHLRELYDAEIRFTDDQIGRLLEVFEERGALDSTVVVFAADHGEEFYEHDRWGHQRTLFEPSVRIPLALAGPGLPSGLRVAGRAQIHDLFTTVATLCEIEVPGYVEGRDLAERWRDPTSAGPASFLHIAVPQREIELSALVDDGLKAIFDHRAGAVSLYDLERDPGEQRALEPAVLGQRGEAVAEALVEELARIERTKQILPSAGTAALDDALLEQLEAMGYSVVDEREEPPR